MGRKSNEEVLNGVHAEALREFDAIQSALRNERLQCLQDRRFYSVAGAQWEGPLGLQFQNKPKFEVNKIHLAVIRIINEYRNNRISVNFVPKDGGKQDELADACTGLYRANEQDSAAEEAYDNAFEEAVGGGFGAWRLRNDYVSEDEEDEDEEKQQRICIEPIFDADSCVFFDLGAKRQDKADAKRCFVLSAVPISQYKEEWGDDPASWPKIVHQHEFDWLTPDVVYVAEYYKVEKSKKVYSIFRGPNDQEEKYDEEELEDEDLLRQLEATGFREVRRKTVKTKRVHKYIMSGSKILEDCGFIAGRHIPIVPVYGKRWFVDNVERCMGHVRLAKDAQRVKNMLLSKLGEISALSTVEKPIFTPEQVSGLSQLWAEDNIKNNPYMLVNAVTGPDGNAVAEGPVGYTKVPQVPPATAALLQLVEEDIKDVLGNQEAGEQLQTAASGIAIELINNRLDMQTYIYISNMAKAMRRSGEIWLSMAKDVLVEEGRKMKSINSNGEAESVELMRAVMDSESDELKTENDISKADFDVAVEVGPTSASKRASIARSAVNMLGMSQDPETQQVLTSLAIMNMEGEGLSDIRSYFRKKLVKIGAVKPTEEEQQELEQAAANAQPDPQAQYLQAAANQANAAANKAQADTILTAAKAEEAKARVMEIMAGIDISKQQHVLQLIETAMGMQRQNDVQQVEQSNTV